jgi:cytochrome c553
VGWAAKEEPEMLRTEMRISAWIGRLAAIAIACSAAWGCAQLPEREEASTEEQERVWSEAIGESSEALGLTGDAQRGKVIYQTCSNCHFPNGVGIPDGSIPQIAGQHRTVLIKQLTDIRTGLRYNAVMYPFTINLGDPEDLADLAAYIQSLPIPKENGKGPGAGLDRGKQLYDQNCLSCHGRYGEGSAEQFYPMLTGQHYAYLLRQIADIRDGRRGNAHPHMARLIEEYDDEDLSAMVDYASRLRPPAPANRGAD